MVYHRLDTLVGGFAYKAGLMFKSDLAPRVVPNLLAALINSGCARRKRGDSCGSYTIGSVTTPVLGCVTTLYIYAYSTLRRGCVFLVSCIPHT